MREEQSQELLSTIARCPNVRHCLEASDTGHPCVRIVEVQQATPESFQLPEPWSGDLEHAPILFLGSNPGLAPSEEYPTLSWPSEDVADFFKHRFGGGRKEWVKDGLYALLREDRAHQGDAYKSGWVRYWAALRKRATEILGRADVRPGVDYAMSEVVHCKSKGEIGVRNALEACVSLYLERLIAVSGAKVVVCLGSVAREAVQGKWARTQSDGVIGPVSVGGRERHFGFLPHPNAREDRSFAKYVPEELPGLRQILSASLTP